LTLGILALFASGPIEIFGISHIRNHESDRISCFVKNILSLGLQAEEKDDGFIVYPINKNFVGISGEWETWNDHRFAMSGFLLSSIIPSVIIKNPGCVDKTAPHFFAQVRELGLFGGI